MAGETSAVGIVVPEPESVVTVGVFPPRQDGLQGTDDGIESESYRLLVPVSYRQEVLVSAVVEFSDEGCVMVEPSRYTLP